MLASVPATSRTSGLALHVSARRLLSPWQAGGIARNEHAMLKEPARISSLAQAMLRQDTSATSGARSSIAGTTYVSAAKRLRNWRNWRRDSLAIIHL